ncbi:hypothetical protein Tco_0276511, partial [Tanacetum coccineum]
DRDENPNLNQSSIEYEEEEEQQQSDRVFTPYEFVPINDEEKINDEERWTKKKMTMVEQINNNVSHESGFEQEEEDAYVTLTAVRDIQKTEGPIVNERVTNLEKYLSEMKQVDQYAQAISSIPAIVDRYINNKQREAIQQAIKSHTTECREEALADKREYIDLIDISVRAIIKEEYITDKDLFETYGEVFTLKRSRDDKDKDQDPSTGSDRVTKRRKSSKDAESSRDLKSKESKSRSSSKGTSHSQHKSFGKSAHAEELSNTVNDSEVRPNQEFDTGNNDEQPNDEVVSKSDWYKKPEQPTTPDPDWNKRQHVEFRPSQT